MTGSSKKYYLFYITFFLFIFTALIFYFVWKDYKKSFVFSMLDIGQGDALFIESPTGVQVLVDAGPPKKVLDELQKTMSPFDKSIDAIIITNPDQDHIGGFLDILKVYKVDKVFEPGTTNDSKIYQELENEISKQKIPHFLARKGTVLELGGGANLEILFPDRNVSDWERNDGSVVARLTYGDLGIMLMGDATRKTEKIILAESSKENFKSTFLKVGHHGSRTSTSFDFLKIVEPNFALISVGKNNKYGHPHSEILDLLSKNKVNILRTDELGQIKIKCDKMKRCKIKK